jgi:hypothetical protein
VESGIIHAFEWALSGSKVEVSIQEQRLLLREKLSMSGVILLIKGV